MWTRSGKYRLGPPRHNDIDWIAGHGSGMSERIRKWKNEFLICN